MSIDVTTSTARDDAARARGLRRVLLLTLGLNVAVAVAKVVVGTLAGSISIRADGFHSSTDGLNNVILLLATTYAAAPPDREHPYGHRKIELFAAAGIGVALLGIAWNIGSDVVTRLRDGGRPPDIDALTLTVLLVTLGVNVLVAWYERRAAQRLQSPALLSDAAHTASDIAVTVGVLVGALFVRAGYAVVDVFAGVLVAGFIAWTGVGILRDNLRFLVDTALVDVDAVNGAARAVEGVTAADGVRSRGAPGAAYVDLNVRVDGAMTVRAAHAVAHAVEARVRQQVAGVVDVHVHVEPADRSNAPDAPDAQKPHAADAPPTARSPG
jgi:cation diffusion facilitator family transporter